jgi:hypothetical protein
MGWALIISLKSHKLFTLFLIMFTAYCPATDETESNLSSDQAWDIAYEMYIEHGIGKVLLNGTLIGMYPDPYEN